MPEYLGPDNLKIIEAYALKRLGEAEIDIEENDYLEIKAVKRSEGSLSGGRKNVGLILSYPKDAVNLLLSSTPESAIPAETVLGIDRGNIHWGVSTSINPHDGSLRLHPTYMEEKPRQYRDWDCLWEETKIKVDIEGNIQLIQTAASLTKGSGRNLRKKDLDTFRSFEWEEKTPQPTTLHLNEQSALGRLFKELGLPQTFQKNTPFLIEGSNPIALQQTISNILMNAFQRV